MYSRFYSMRVTSCIPILLTLLIAGCNRHSPNTQTIQLNQVISETGISFPNTSTVTDSSRLDTIIDPLWAARITVPAQSGKTLVDHLKSIPDETVNYAPGFANTASWWMPKKVIYTKKYSHDVNYFVFLVVSEESGDYVFYIENCFN